MPSTLDLSIGRQFQRPIDVVRAHFLDMRHHIEHDVHKGVRYTILEDQGAKQRIRQQFKVLGMPQTDELLLYADADGSVVQDFVKGQFEGGQLRIRFQEVDGATHAEATFRFPLRGMMRLIKPILARVVLSTARQALEEDRIDLEQHGYAPAAARARA